MSSNTLERDPEEYRREYLCEPDKVRKFVGGPWHGRIERTKHSHVLVPDVISRVSIGPNDLGGEVYEESWLLFAYREMRVLSGPTVMTCVSDAETQAYWNRPAFKTDNGAGSLWLAGEIRLAAEDAFQALEMKVSYFYNGNTDLVTYAGCSRRFPHVCLFYQMEYGWGVSRLDICHDLCTVWADALVRVE